MKTGLLFSRFQWWVRAMVCIFALRVRDSVKKYLIFGCINCAVRFLRVFRVGSGVVMQGGDGNKAPSKGLSIIPSLGGDSSQGSKDVASLAAGAVVITTPASSSPKNSDRVACCGCALPSYQVDLLGFVVGTALTALLLLLLFPWLVCATASMRSRCKSVGPGYSMNARLWSLLRNHGW